MRLRRTVEALARRGAVVAALAAGAGAATAQTPEQPIPVDSIRRLPDYRPAYDTVTLLAPAKLAALTATERAAWQRYLARSAALYARDTAAMHAELRSLGRAKMTRAPYTHDFSVKPFMTPAWFAGDTARRIAESILSFQAPNGGWSKHVDFARERRPGESYYAESDDWSWISTLDNDQTTAEMRFLGAIDRVQRDARYERAFDRGLGWLLDAQYPNGCWPQVYPLEGSYHDAATFNDDAIRNAIVLLREIADGEYAFVPRPRRDDAARAVHRGVACVVDAQYVAHGRPTVWGQQHDPLTLLPTSARSYELASLTAQESAHLVDLLMSIAEPSPRVVSAVYDAVDWLRAAPVLRGYRYEHYTMTADPHAPTLWGRSYDLATNRIFFANRDGIKRYSIDELTDRRTGYGWYTEAPDSTLRAFDRWSRAHPRPPAARRATDAASGASNRDTTEER